MWAIGWILLNTWSTIVVWKTYFNSSVQNGSKLSRRFKKVWLGLKMATEILLGEYCHFYTHLPSRKASIVVRQSYLYNIKNELVKSVTKLPLRKTSKRGVMKRKEESFLRSIRGSPKLYRRKTLVTDWVWSSHPFILPSRPLKRLTNNNFSLINIKYLRV